MIMGKFQRVTLVPMNNTLQWMIMESPSVSRCNWYHTANRHSTGYVEPPRHDSSEKEK